MQRRQEGTRAHELTNSGLANQNCHLPVTDGVQRRQPSARVLAAGIKALAWSKGARMKSENAKKKKTRNEACHQHMDVVVASGHL